MLTPPDQPDQEEPTTAASPGDDRGTSRPGPPEPPGPPPTTRAGAAPSSTSVGGPGRAVSHASSDRTHSRTRAATLWGGLGFGVFFLLAVLIFIIQNGARAKVHFVTLQGTLPLGVALLLAAVGGALVAVFFGAVRINQLRRVASRHHRGHT